MHAHVLPLADTYSTRAQFLHVHSYIRMTDTYVRTYASYSENATRIRLPRANVLGNKTDHDASPEDEDLAEMVAVGK